MELAIDNPVTQKHRVERNVLAYVDVTHRAIKLLKMGFRPPVVAAELKLPSITARILYKHIYNKRPPGGSPRGLSNMLRYVPTRRESSFLAITYLTLLQAENKTLSNAGIEEVYAAHNIYIKRRQETELKNLPRHKPLTISDAYEIVQVMREGSIQLRHCHECEAISICQPEISGLHSCPFCSPRHRVI